VGTKETTIRRNEYARIEVRVRFNGLDANEFEIEGVEVVEPGDSVGIRLEDPRDYK